MKNCNKNVLKIGLQWNLFAQNKLLAAKVDLPYSILHKKQAIIVNTYNLLRSEIKQPGPEYGGREEPQEDEARHDRVAYFRVAREVSRGALT